MALAISMTDNKKSTYIASTNSIHLIEKQDAQVHKYKHRIAKFLKEVSSWPRLLLRSVCVFRRRLILWVTQIPSVRRSRNRKTSIARWKAVELCTLELSALIKNGCRRHWKTRRFWTVNRLNLNIKTGTYGEGTGRRKSGQSLDSTRRCRFKES
jgi:hypothetical protein